MKLQVLTWDNVGISHLEQVERLLDAGADWIQLRQKNVENKLKTAIQAVKLCRKYNATIIINDSAEIALESGASGVHLGLSDMNPTEARKILGKNAIIGGTCNTKEHALQRISQGCDYIGLGPYRFTCTKENLSTPLTKETIKDIAKLSIPTILIGGITKADIEEIFSLGVQGIAVSSAIVAAKDLEGAFNEIHTNLRSIKKHQETCLIHKIFLRCPSSSNNF